MFRRFTNRGRLPSAFAAGVLTIGLLAPDVVAASPAPLVMGPLYVEPARTSDNPAPPSASGCVVQVLELKDTRRAADTLGTLMTFKAIQAPADREAWLRSVVEVGLTSRGFKPTFAAADAAAPPGAVTARIRLTAIWLSIQAMNKSGSVVVRMTAAAPATAAGSEKIYRADQVAVNWAGTQSEFNGLVDKLFAETLDAMAADLRPLCPPAAQAATTPPATAPVTR